MEILERFASWVANNESLFSGLAALVALAALVPALLRPLLRNRRKEWARSRAARKPGEAGGSEGDGSSEDEHDGAARIAVFPIAAPTDAPDASLAAEIIGEELTTLLARSPGCEVVSSRSSSAHSQRGGALSDAAGALGVRYVVEGSLRPVPGGHRVSMSLVDARTDRVGWSEAFVIDADAAQEAAARRVAEEIAAHLGVEITRAEVDRERAAARDEDAEDLLLRAQGILFDQGHNRRSYAEAIALLEEAIRRDPSNPRTHSQLALLIALGSVFGLVDEATPEERVAEICRRALQLDDRSSEVLGYVGCAFCDLRQYEQGMPLLERAIEANPSNAQAKAAYGTALIGRKRYDEAIEYLEDALRLAPPYKGNAPWATVLATAYLRRGRLEDARASMNRSLRCDPTFFPTHLMAAVLAMGDADPETAKRHLREARRTQPELDETAIQKLVGRRAGAELAALESDAA